MQVNLIKLNKQLYYHPPWQEDKIIFTKLFRKSNFQDEDIILFARLYVKYSHLHCFDYNELTKYFNYMLQKMQIHNSINLFNITKNIYNKSDIHYD